MHILGRKKETAINVDLKLGSVGNCQKKQKPTKIKEEQRL